MVARNKWGILVVFCLRIRIYSQSFCKLFFYFYLPVIHKTSTWIKCCILNDNHCFYSFVNHDINLVNMMYGHVTAWPQRIHCRHIGELYEL